MAARPPRGGLLEAVESMFHPSLKENSEYSARQNLEETKMAKSAKKLNAKKLEKKAPLTNLKGAR